MKKNHNLDTENTSASINNEFHQDWNSNSNNDEELMTTGSETIDNINLSLLSELNQIQEEESDQLSLLQTGAHKKKTDMDNMDSDYARRGDIVEGNGFDFMGNVNWIRENLSMQNIAQNFRYLLYTYRQFVMFTLKDIKSKKITFTIGLSSCFIVVWMVIMSITALDKVPLIFLRLGELNNGEFDFRVMALPSTPGVSINFHNVLASINGPHTTPEDHEEFSYIAPRMVMGAVYSTSASSCTDKLGFNPNSISVHDAEQWKWMYIGAGDVTECGQMPPDRTADQLEKQDLNFGQFCVPALCSTHAYDAIMIIYDHDLEKRMEFGRQWSHPKLEPGEVYLTSAIANELKVTAGDNIIVTLPLMDQFIGPYREADMLPSDPSQPANRVTFNSGNIHIPVKVKSAFDYTKFYGKMSTYTKSAVMIEYSTILSHLAKFLPPQLFNSTNAALLAKVDLYNYTEYVYVNHPPSRLDLYNHNDYNIVQKKLVDFGSRAVYLMGFDQLRTHFPVLEYMRNTRFFSLFLGLIISIIVTILSTLSVILIYSLLMINVENRTFEMGVLRMLGIKKSGVVQLILVQAFFYAFPGWVLGIILGQVSFAGVSVILGKTLEVDISKAVTWRAFGLATALGILIPLISSIIPIWTAMSQNLTESLDVTRSKTKAVKYSIERASEGNINWTSIIVGALMAVFGAGVYYFFPLSLLSFNFSFLLYMFFGLLLAMLLGLIMLSLNVENTLEFIVTWIFFFWENYAVRDIVMKNLVAHRLRNRKTTIMFSLSLGFIIFLTLSFTGQISTFKYNVLRSYGTRFNLVASNHHGFHSQGTKQELENICLSSRVCGGFTYVSFSLADATPLSAPQIMSKGRWRAFHQDIYAVSPNFYDVTGTKFLVVDDELRPSNLKFRVYDTSLSNLLYTVRGSFSAIIGTLFKKQLDITLDDSYLIETSRGTMGFPLYKYHLLKPMAFLDASPVGLFSQYPLITWQSIFVSFPTFVRLSNGTLRTINDIPIEKMLLNVKEDGYTRSEFKDFVNKVEAVARRNNLKLLDMNDELSPLTIATQVLSFFSIFTTVVAMSICFFSLMSSMYSNINEQAKEIGILRAIGARKWTIVRIFIYESFILIIAASLMGIIIGLTIGYTMALQNTLFTQLPLDLIIPWQIILEIFLLAVVFSFISSLGPILNLLRLPIVVILRRIIG